MSQILNEVKQELKLEDEEEDDEELEEEDDEEEELEEEEDPQPQQIQILDYQVEHFKKILQILQNEPGYLDVSEFGCGKTIIALAIAATFGMSIGLVGPKTILNAWKTQAKKYGIHIYFALSYNALRGTAKYGTSHDLLNREGSVFTTTDTFEECAKNGLLLVFDECHNLKNENEQLEAAHCLTREVVRLAKTGYNVRIAALSATPADKKENITSLFKVLGVITNPKLYTYIRSSKTYVLEGLQEAVNKCNKYDPDVTFHVLCRPVNKTTSKMICHELYTRVLKKIVTSSMPRPESEYEKDIKNLYAIMPPEDVERMKKGALLFSSATSYKHETQEISYSGMNWGMVTQSRREIDSAKVATMVRLSKEKLDKYPNCKVVLYYTFKRDMYRSEELLKRYNPLVMNGDVTDENVRTDMMNKFQRNDNKYRVFISNPKVGGLGVELDDKYGHKPRFMFIAPSYMFIDQFQATGRIHRKGTKSKATIRFIYSKDFNYETGILTSMMEKSKVARDMTQANQKDIVFPGELPDETEGEEEE
tara:strand:+ start:2722 stop:4326 length:1605 start_codon:yes stop_codon:yes gene_type:complete